MPTYPLNTATIKIDPDAGAPPLVYNRNEGKDATAQRILRVANQVALEHAPKHHWSSFHLWQYYRSFRLPFPRNGSGGLHVAMAAESMWDDMDPFANCLGLSFILQEAFKEALQDDEELAPFADRVELLTNSPGVIAQGDLEYHCVTALRLWNHAIVIDFVSQPEAIMVPQNAVYTCINHLERYQQEGSYKWEWLYLCKRGGRRDLLTTHSETQNGTDYNSYSYPYVPITIRRAVCSLAFPPAKKLKTPRTPNEPWLPSNKHIFTNVVLDYKPLRLSYTKLGDSKYLIEGADIRISFRHKMIEVWVPYVDWLMDSQFEPEWRRLKIELTGEDIPRPPLRFEMLPLDLEACYRRETKELEELLIAVVAELGVRRKEFVHIVNDVLDYLVAEKFVGGPYPETKTKSEDSEYHPNSSDDDEEMVGGPDPEKKPKSGDSEYHPDSSDDEKMEDQAIESDQDVGLAYPVQSEYEMTSSEKEDDLSEDQKGPVQQEVESEYASADSPDEDQMAYSVQSKYKAASSEVEDDLVEDQKGPVQQEVESEYTSADSSNEDQLMEDNEEEVELASKKFWNRHLLLTVRSDYTSAQISDEDEVMRDEEEEFDSEPFSDRSDEDEQMTDVE